MKALMHLSQFVVCLAAAVIMLAGTVGIAHVFGHFCQGIAPSDNIMQGILAIELLLAISIWAILIALIAGKLFDVFDNLAEKLEVADLLQPK